MNRAFSPHSKFLQVPLESKRIRVNYIDELRVAEGMGPAEREGLLPAVTAQRGIAVFVTSRSRLLCECPA